MDACEEVEKLFPVGAPLVQDGPEVFLDEVGPNTLFTWGTKAFGYYMTSGGELVRFPLAWTNPFRAGGAREASSVSVGANQVTVLKLRDTQPKDPDPSLATPAQDADVVRPEHYSRFVIEPIEFIMKNAMEFWRGNPIKYIARAGYKLYPGCDAKESEIKDISKAIRMLEMRLNDLKGAKVL